MAIIYNRDNRTMHAQFDHPERMRLLEEYIGFTNIVVEIIELGNNGRLVRKGLTSSGIIIIRGIYEDTMITAYMAHEYQAKHICKKAGKKCIPPKLIEKVRKNAVRHPELLDMLS